MRCATRSSEPGAHEVSDYSDGWQYTQVGAAGAGHCPNAAFIRTTDDGSVGSAAACQALCTAEADCFFVSYRLI